MKGKVWKENYRKLCQQHWIIHDLELMSCVRRCSVCNKKFIKIDRTVHEDDDLSAYAEEHKMCYECAYWSVFLESPRPEGLQVTGGVCYQVLPFVEEPTIYMLLGSRGEKRYFVTRQLEVIKSNDVWRIGRIPERFRDKLPDTGWFCNKSIYGKITNFNKRCNEIGCLDRYKCLRFKYELELENRPFNKVPEDWVAGGEHCLYFINTDLLENYVSPIKTE